MKFRNLTPTLGQPFHYQLWIFDDRRPASYPVDGGVFDVTDSGGIYVPIDARLPIHEAFAFVVTREPTGGVVVSDRSAIITLADDVERL